MIIIIITEVVTIMKKIDTIVCVKSLGTKSINYWWFLITYQTFIKPDPGGFVIRSTLNFKSQRNEKMQLSLQGTYNFQSS